MSGQVRPSIETRMDALLENKNNARRSQRTSPPRTAHAPLLKSSSGIPGDVPHPRRQAARKRPDIAATVGGARRASPPQTIHGPASAVRSRLKSPSFGLAPIRTHGVRDGVELVSSGRGVAGPTTLPVFRPIRRAGMLQAAPRPLPRSRPRRSRRRPAAREQT